MEMPRPSAEAERLVQALSGTWEGPETMHPSPWSPEPAQRVGRYTNRTLDGFFLLVDYEQRDGEQVTFRGHGVYSWDAREEVYTMYWFDSMGGAGGISKGRMEGDVLTFETTSPMGQHRYQYTFGDGSKTFEMSMSPDGENWQQFMKANYAKQ